MILVIRQYYISTAGRILGKTGDFYAERHYFHTRKPFRSDHKDKMLPAANLTIHRFWKGENNHALYGYALKSCEIAARSINLQEKLFETNIVPSAPGIISSTGIEAGLILWASPMRSSKATGISCPCAHPA